MRIARAPWTRWPMTLAVTVATLVACGGGDKGGLGGEDGGTGTSSTPTAPPVETGDPAPIEDEDAGTIGPLPDGGPTPTWTQIYDRYFGPGSLGHCGDANCHREEGDQFKCGTTKDECYQGLVNKDLILVADPRRSRLVNRVRTPLAWYGTVGQMPKNEVRVNKTAADEIDAWVAGGAKKD
ncbi:MAG: hypothetical protein U0169_20275 [Polyangiaceae bacterium]